MLYNNYTIKERKYVDMNDTNTVLDIINTDDVQPVDEEITEEAKDELKVALEDQFKKIQTQSMLLGAQAMCSTILQKITVFENQPGKRTLNDHRRLIKDLKKFAETGLSRTVNLDGTTSPIEEDNTKLMEESDE